MHKGNDLYAIHRRVLSARAQVVLQITKLERERDALMRRGSRAQSRSVQEMLAHRVLQIDRQRLRWDHTLILLNRLLSVLGNLIYAREMKDDRTLRRLQGVDWEALLRGVEAAAEAQAEVMQRLDALMNAMGIPPAGRVPKAHPGKGRVEEVALAVKVPDGDGLVLSDGRRVRYIGIDAPEMWNRWHGGEDPFAREAKVLNERLVAGKRVQLIRDMVDQDKYGRLLRYVYVGKIFVNAEMVRRGLARALRVPPNEAHAGLFEKLEQEARHKRVGMWAAGNSR